MSRLDRLARDTRFLLTLLDSGLDVEFCDLPTMAGPMGKMVVTVMAAVAEMEAGLISERTKAGLRIARERGVVLGGRNAQPTATRKRRQSVTPRCGRSSNGF